jgi:hypothetical protein
MTMTLSQLLPTSLSVDTKKFIHLGYGHDGGGLLGFKKFRAVFGRKFSGPLYERGLGADIRRIFEKSDQPGLLGRIPSTATSALTPFTTPDFFALALVLASASLASSRESDRIRSASIRSSQTPPPIAQPPGGFVSDVA